MRGNSRHSLLLVTVDCLRADHTGFAGYGRPTTPFLDSLSAESFIFPAAMVCGAPTYYSVPSILASRYPLALGREHLGLAPGEVNIATILRDTGYATAAFCAGNPYISARFGYDQGFDTFRDFLSEASTVTRQSERTRNGSWLSRLNRGIADFSHRMGPLGNAYDELYFQYCQRWATGAEQSMDELRRFPSADVVVNEALSWLSGVGDRPFFLWLHFMDPHSPYYPNTEALRAMDVSGWTPFRARYENSFWNRGDVGTRRLQSHKSDIVALYDAGISWVDTQMARLVAGLTASSRWDQCVLAFTADHGEEFLDHQGRYHPPTQLYEELVHVPLMLRVPHKVPMVLSDGAFSLLHLAPTLLDVLGIAGAATFQGHSYWSQIQKGEGWATVAIAESIAGCTNPFLPEKRLGPRVLAVRDARFKLILHFDPPGERLYDLKVDPREQSPLALHAEKPVRRRLLEAARDHLQRSASERDARAGLRSRLRELQLEWAMQSARPVAS